MKTTIEHKRRMCVTYIMRANRARLLQIRSQADLEATLIIRRARTYYVVEGGPFRLAYMTLGSHSSYDVVSEVQCNALVVLLRIIEECKLLMSQLEN